MLGSLSTDGAALPAYASYGFDSLKEDRSAMKNEKMLRI